MPPRPAPPSSSTKSNKYATNRLSAVYIGPNPISNSYHSSSSPSQPSHISARSPPVGNPDIPDLPEPPSPGGSSTGLPSPPATNSTGSGNGSTGDPTSVATHERERPVSLNSSSSSSSSLTAGGSAALTGAASHRKNGSVGSIASAASTARLDERSGDGEHGDVDDNDYDNFHNDGRMLGHGNHMHNEEDVEDGDDTARLDRRQPLGNTSNENVLALQRVRTLTERNRVVRIFSVVVVL